MKPQYISKAFGVLCLLFVAVQNSFAQSNPNTDKKWADLFIKYQSGVLNDTAYLNRVQILVDESGTDPTLKKKLSTYKKIAWGNPAYQKPRLFYYLFLYNNALYTYNAGASIYYTEKAEEERKKIKPYTPSLLEPVAMMYNYGRTKSGYNKCFEVYNSLLPFLAALPQKIASDSVPINTIQNAMALLTDITYFYQERKDTANAFKACALSENIWQSVKKKKLYTIAALHRPHLSYYLAQWHKKEMLQQYGSAKKMLDTAFAIVVNNREEYLWWTGATSDMYRNYFDFFIRQKETDSASHYLELIKNRQDSALADLGDGTTYLYNYGKLKALGNYKAAYQNMLHAYEINDSIIGVKTADINNNMYSQALAEDKSEALKKIEEAQQNRNVLIIIIFTISLNTIIILYVYIRKKEKETKNAIYKLTYASQLQIMELEEKSLSIKEKEQRRLGMDLHDGLAGTIAAIKRKVETELAGINDPGQAERLEAINKLVEEIYESTRDKSHKLYLGIGNEPGIAFSKRIKLITDNSFTSNKYKIQIDVEDSLMKEVALEIKIQLIYIIQEAVTNIIKHSSANAISILIYEDTNTLILYIADNGKGFNTTFNKKGIGLNSISERAAAINGAIKITSGRKGTEIVVTIPTVADG